MAQVRTEAEMFPLVESWQKSGLTQKRFSQHHEIDDQVFYYWVARYRKAQPVLCSPNSGSVAKTKPVPPADVAAAFIRLSPPVDPVAPSVKVSTDATTVVELPSGVVLRFTGLVPVNYLKELVGLSNLSI